MCNTIVFDDYDLDVIRHALNCARRSAIARYQKHFSLAKRSCTSEFVEINEDLAMDANCDVKRFEKLLAKINTL